MEIILVKGNTYVLDLGLLYLPFYKINQTDIILLDTGLKKEHREILLNFLEENKHRVTGIICTHSHIDHAGNAAFFKEKYGAKVAMSREEAMILSSTLELKIFYANQTLTQIEEHYGHMVVQADIIIEDDDKSVEVGGITFGIIHTPGHSSGHVAITTPDNVTYLGDSLISYEVMKSSKLPYAHILRKDLVSKMKLYTLASDRYILAHKGIFDDIKDLITDNIYFYKQRAEEILELVDKAMTTEDILRAVSKSKFIRIGSVNKYIVIERMLKCYIEYLCETSKLMPIIDDGFIKYVRTDNSQNPA
ncbi:MAG: MBL fold metallo-hydrolase [Clostridiaceae bacterium]